jgi:hypothetical protein
MLKQMITKAAAGEVLDKLPEEDLRKLLEELTVQLRQIHTLQREARYEQVEMSLDNLVVVIPMLLESG